MDICFGGHHSAPYKQIYRKVDNFSLHRSMNWIKPNTARETRYRCRNMTPRHPGNPSLLSVIAPHSKGPTTQPLNGLVSNLASTKPGVSASFAHHSVWDAPLSLCTDSWGSLPCMTTLPSWIPSALGGHWAVSSSSHYKCAATTSRGFTALGVQPLIAVGGGGGKRAGLREAVLRAHRCCCQGDECTLPSRGPEPRAHCAHRQCCLPVTSAALVCV